MRSSSEEEVQQGVGTLAERRAQELDEIPTVLLEYALGMAERAEAFDSMESLMRKLGIDPSQYAA